MRRMPIRKQLQVIALALMAVLFLLQLRMQYVFLDGMGALHEDNVEDAIARVVDDLQVRIAQQEAAVTHIAAEQDVITYAATQDSEARYALAFGAVQPVVRTAVRNLAVDYVAIYDTTQAWYQFVGALQFADYQYLRSLFADDVMQRTVPLVLRDTLYLCTAEPLMSASGQQVRRHGLVVALTGADTLRAVLPPQDAHLAVTVLLHDGQNILLSNVPQLDGVPLMDGPVAARDYHVRSHTILPGLQVTVSVPRNLIFPERTAWLLAFAVVALFSVLALVLILTLSTRWFSRPITQVMQGMAALPPEGGERLLPTGVGHIDPLVDSINSLLDRVEASTQAELAARQAVYEAELERQNARLLLLKKQINAHFLYNCLAGIKALTDEGEAQLAGEMAQGVGLLMRYTHSTQEEVNVFDEMSIIQRYVGVMNIRFRDRFDYTFEVDDGLVAYSIRKLLLQPLVENALVHGLEKRGPGACRLHVTGVQDGQMLVFTVSDNGVGIDAETLAALRASIAAVGDTYEYWRLKGISLVNIQKRVLTAYGEGYGLTIDSWAGQGTVVTLRVPAILEDT